jgi:hypothetical protein
LLAGAGRIGLTGLAARTAARAGAGAVSATAALAPITALEYGVGLEENADYGLRDAFRDLAFNAVAGAVLHAGFGAVREYAATAKHDAMKAAIAQLQSEREVNVAPVLDAARLTEIIREATAPPARRYTTEPDHEAPGRYVAKDSAGRVVATGDSPEQAIQLAQQREAPTAPAGPYPEPAGIPPVKEGFVRFYHGQPPGEGAAPPGARWVTPDYRYARDFRSTATEPAKVFYIDLPKGHPEEVAMREWQPGDEAAGLNIVGRYHTAELPEDVVAQHGMRPVPAEAAPKPDVLREAPAPAAPPTPAEVAAKEAALDREGSVQGTPQSEVAAAKAEIQATEPHPPELQPPTPEELAAAEREFAALPQVARTAEEQAELAASSEALARSEGLAKGLDAAAGCIARGLI